MPIDAASILDAARLAGHRRGDPVAGSGRRGHDSAVFGRITTRTSPRRKREELKNTEICLTLDGQSL